MKDRKLASRYAKALLAAIPDRDQRESIDAFLTSLARHLQESAEFRGVMLDPAISREARKRLLSALAAERGLSQRLVNFLRTLVDNNRIVALPTIAAVYHEEVEQAMGIVPAELTTATPLDDPMQQRARAAVEKMTGKRVRLTCRVDPGLMGGAVTRIGSMVYDGSLRNQLDQLRRRMAQD